MSIGTGTPGSTDSTPGAVWDAGIAEVLGIADGSLPAWSINRGKAAIRGVVVLAIVPFSYVLPFATFQGSDLDPAALAPWFALALGCLLVPMAIWHFVGAVRGGSVALTEEGVRFDIPIRPPVTIRWAGIDAVRVTTDDNGHPQLRIHLVPETFDPSRLPFSVWSRAWGAWGWTDKGALVLTDAFAAPLADIAIAIEAAWHRRGRHARS